MIFKRRYRFLILVVVLFSANVLSAGDTDPLVYQYDVYFQGLPAGYARLEKQIVSDDTVQAIFILNTKGLINRFFPIRDTISVTIDTRDYSTIRWEKHIHEGKYHRKKLFDRKGEKTDQRIRDEYSALMMLMDNRHFRSRNVKIVLPIKENVEEITLSFVQQEYIDGDKSFFWTNLYEPSNGSIELIKNGENRMWVWMKDSVPSFPVRLKLQFKYGNVLLKVKE